MRRRDFLAGLSAASLGPAAPARAAGPSAYRRGNGADPETLDPHKTSTVAEATILLDLYEGLSAYGPDGTLVPGAASGWTTSADGLTWAFSLRPDGRWSNGDSVVADDFVHGFRRMLDPGTGRNTPACSRRSSMPKRSIAGRCRWTPSGSPPRIPARW